MAVSYIDYPNRESWLKGRQNTIGASEVACIFGCGFMNELSLWKVKTGREQEKDLSLNERVSYGMEAEAHLRGLFLLKSRKTYSVDYFPYRVYKTRQNEYLHATLDGELTRLADGVKGILECKTVWIVKKDDLEEWNGRVPQKYYIQCVSQMASTGYQFAILTVELIMPDKNSEIRNYLIERNEEEIRLIWKEVERFRGYVVKNTPPPVTLNL